MIETSPSDTTTLRLAHSSLFRTARLIFRMRQTYVPDCARWASLPRAWRATAAALAHTAEALAEVGSTVEFAELAHRTAAAVPAVLEHGRLGLGPNLSPGLADVRDERRPSEGLRVVQIEVAENLQTEFDMRNPAHSSEDLEPASKDRSFR
jgi:hypothetical protein